MAIVSGRENGRLDRIQTPKFFAHRGGQAEQSI
jgi:hypothetical protein